MMTNHASLPSVSDGNTYHSQLLGANADSAICDITLNISDMLDDTLTLDIPDELPAHLARGEEARLTQLSRGAGHRLILCFVQIG